jgi:putative transposase
LPRTSPSNGASLRLRFDNGSEFASRATLRWGAERSVNRQFIDPGKPTQNAHIESFNGKIRDELVNAHSFRTIFEARRARRRLEARLK